MIQKVNLKKDDISNLNSINLSFVNKEIIILNSPSSSFYIEHEYDDEYEKVTTSCKEGRLNYEVEIIKSHFFFNIFRKHPTQIVYVYVPSLFEGSLIVYSLNGRIDASSLQINKLYLETSNASINLKDARCEDVKLVTSNAKINVNNCESNNLETESSNGEIVFDSLKNYELLNASTSNAKIILNEVDSHSLKLSTSNARICGMIKGSIQDFNIKSETTNASSSLPRNIEASTNKFLYACTSNAKIDIEFYH